MNRDEILIAVDKARIFIDVATITAERLEKEKSLAISGCRETGATRRASMDLTRALAYMRRSHRRYFI